MEIDELGSGTESDSDIELQEAFAKGLLKPGFNVVTEKATKQFKNDVNGLKRKLSSFQQNLPWIETLVLVTDVAELSPELAHKLEEQKQNFLKTLNKKGKKTVNVEDPAMNDLQRELMFHRQAQAAVMEGLSRLKELGISTKRPDDYFAQMAKSDEHMQKVRESLLKKQHEMDYREKVRQIRQMRKTNKQLQIQSKLKRASEKSELMDQVKKYRQKMNTNLDFLDDKKNKFGKKNLRKRTEAKRKFKDQKFGFGGKKRGSKFNTKESASDVSEYRRPNREKGNKKKGPQRPGKSKRIKLKARQKH